MKITFIGGSGFVGTRLIAILKEDLKNNYQLKNIDLQQSHFHPEITEIGDVRIQECMDEKLAEADCVILLAAQHRDDVYPTSQYYETNVGGMEKTLKAMEKNGVKRIVFYSSVAVYGLNKKNPTETHPADPFNHYGKSKWQAELVLQKWYKSHPDWNINKLEEELGVNILVRHSSGVVLTKEGEYLAEYSKKMLLEYELMKKHINNLKLEKEKTINIGVSTTVAKYKLASILHDFKEKYPDIKINLKTGASSSELPILLKENKIQLALLRGDGAWGDVKYIVNSEPYGIITNFPLMLKNCNLFHIYNMKQKM